MGIFSDFFGSGKKSTSKNYYVFMHEGPGTTRKWKETRGPFDTRQEADDEVRSLKSQGWLSPSRLVVKHLTTAEKERVWRADAPASFNARKTSSSKRAKRR